MRIDISFQWLLRRQPYEEFAQSRDRLPGCVKLKYSGCFSGARTATRCAGGAWIDSS